MSISIFDIFEIEECTIVQEVHKNIKWLSVYFHDPFIVIYRYMNEARMAQWVRSLDLTAHTSISPIRRGFAPSFVNYKKGALDSQWQVIVSTYFIVQKHDNRIRYKFFNLEHLLLYINNIQIQLNINTQKLQSFLIIRKTTKNNNMKCTSDKWHLNDKSNRPLQ